MLRHHFTAFAIVVSLLLLPASVFSAVSGEIVQDFEPLSGYVVMPAGEEFLIDLDAEKGVAVGDLFAVIAPGQEIVHPVTKEVLGTLEEVRGILRVTRIKKGYSHAEPLGEPEGIEAGDVVRRYERIPVFFRDRTGGGEAFYAELKEALPSLQWEGYAALEAGDSLKPASMSGGPALLFILDEEGLQVREADGGMIHSYPAAAEKAAVKAPQVGAPAAVPSVPAPAVVQAAPKPSALVRSEAPPAEGLWISDELEGVARGIAVADFDGDGANEVAALFLERIEVGEIGDGEYRRTAQIDLDVSPKPLAIDSADLDGDGRQELYVTAADREHLRSLRIGFDGSGYRIEEREIGIYFRSVDLPGEGRVLFGQRQGARGRDFSGQVFRVRLADGELVEGEALELPDGVDLYGFLPFTGQQGERLVAVINADDRLKVLGPDGETVWEAEGHFGGSETYVERIDPNLNPVSGDNIRYAYLQKRIEPGAKGELLIPVNEGSRLFSRSKKFKQSRMTAMAWTGHSLREVWRTREQEGRLADFRLADADNDGKDELVQALVFTRKGWNTEGRSAISVIELD